MVTNNTSINVNLIENKFNVKFTITAEWQSAMMYNASQKDDSDAMESLLAVLLQNLSKVCR